MEKMLAVILMTLTLFIGALSGAIMFPTEKQVLVDRDCPESDCPEVDPEVVEVERDFDAYKQDALDLCLKDYADFRNVDKYEEAYLYGVSDNNWNISFDVDNDKRIVKVFDVRYRTRDTLNNDVNHTSNEQTCRVVYEDGEEPDVAWKL
jgi:hypothetical protein